MASVRILGAFGILLINLERFFSTSAARFLRYASKSKAEWFFKVLFLRLTLVIATSKEMFLLLYIIYKNETNMGQVRMFRFLFIAAVSVTVF